MEPCGNNEETPMTVFLAHLGPLPVNASCFSRVGQRPERGWADRREGTKKTWAMRQFWNNKTPYSIQFCWVFAPSRIWTSCDKVHNSIPPWDTHCSALLHGIKTCSTVENRPCLLLLESSGETKGATKCSNDPSEASACSGLHIIYWMRLKVHKNTEAPTATARTSLASVSLSSLSSSSWCGADTQVSMCLYCSLSSWWTNPKHLNKVILTHNFPTSSLLLENWQASGLSLVCWMCSRASFRAFVSAHLSSRQAGYESTKPCKPFCCQVLWCVWWALCSSHAWGPATPSTCRLRQVLARNLIVLSLKSKVCLCWQWASSACLAATLRSSLSFTFSQVRRWEQEEGTRARRSVFSAEMESWAI